MNAQALLPSIAVIIPAYNAAGRLARAVQSVWETGYPRLAVVIVDDGSVDATVWEAEQLCAQDPRCTLLRHEGGANLGVSASRNLGIRHSDSDWIAFLDSDDEYLPNRFEGLSAALRYAQAGEPDAVYDIAEVRTAPGGAGEAKWWSASGDENFGVRHALTGDELLTRLFEGECWQTGAVVVRRAMLEITGVFDPCKKIAEDCDLWFRIAIAGRVVPGDLTRPASVYWRHGANTFVYRLEHRLAMLEAMLDASSFASSRAAAPSRARIARDKCIQYALRSVVVLREAGRPDLAARVLLKVAGRGRLGFLFHWEGFRQSFSVVRELVFRSTKKPGVLPE